MLKKKQKIEVKAIRPVTRMYNTWCGACDKPLGTAFAEIGKAYEDMNNYCPHCGVKLDWTEECKEQAFSIDGFTVIYYGKSSVSVRDKDGHEVMHTGSRAEDPSEENAKAWVESYITLCDKMKNGDWSDEDHDI